MIDFVSEWATANTSSLVLSSLALLCYATLVRLAFPRIEASVSRSNMKEGTTQRAYDTLRLVVAILTVVALLIIWGVDFGGLLLISTSLLTLTGVALFASWSLLSNITAYFILLVHSSFRRGNFIRVIDADNYIEGYIAEVNLFNTRLITADRETVIYPNNLLLARPTIVNPRSSLDGVGKIGEKPLPPPEAKGE